MQNQSKAFHRQLFSELFSPLLTNYFVYLIARMYYFFLVSISIAYID